MHGMGGCRALSADTAALPLLNSLQRAEAIRQKQQQAAEEAEAALFARNPDADYWAPRSSLPPPAGLAKVQQTWAAAAAAGSATAAGSGTPHTQSAAQASGSVPAAGPGVQVLQLTGSKGRSSLLLGSGVGVGGKTAASLTAGEPGATGQNNTHTMSACAHRKHA
jgi:hypothetical protein